MRRSYATVIGVQGRWRSCKLRCSSVQLSMKLRFADYFHSAALIVDDMKRCNINFLLGLTS